MCVISADLICSAVTVSVRFEEDVLLSNGLY